jgi:hypothetical protein
LIWIVHALEAYILAGVLFAPAFVVRGAAAVDPAAKGGTLGFRLLISPGVVALWPLLARRWWRAAVAAPQEARP